MARVNLCMCALARYRGKFEEVKEEKGLFKQTNTAIPFFYLSMLARTTCGIMIVNSTGGYSIVEGRGGGRHALDLPPPTLEIYFFFR